MDGNEQIKSKVSSPIDELQNFKNVNSSLMQDAMNVWADLWAELDGQVGSSKMEKTGIKENFEPSCGWSEFLEKMWVLRYYLDFSKRLSQH
jgi:hypothetical protein